MTRCYDFFRVSLPPITTSVRKSQSKQRGWARACGHQWCRCKGSFRFGHETFGVWRFGAMAKDDIDMKKRPDISSENYWFMGCFGLLGCFFWQNTFVLFDVWISMGSPRNSGKCAEYGRTWGDLILPHSADAVDCHETWRQLLRTDPATQQLRKTHPLQLCHCLGWDGMGMGDLGKQQLKASARMEMQRQWGTQGYSGGEFYTVLLLPASAGHIFDTFWSLWQFTSMK